MRVHTLAALLIFALLASSPIAMIVFGLGYLSRVR